VGIGDRNFLLNLGDGFESKPRFNFLKNSLKKHCTLSMHRLAYTTVVKGKLFKFSFDVSDIHNVYVYDKPDRYMADPLITKRE
jgi:hypothetical protein